MTMTRKDLQEKYDIFGENNDICLYRKKGEYTRSIGYCGNISLKNGKAVFNGQTYATVSELDNALREWENSLPYPVDTYNPMKREICRVEEQIIYYLTDVLGFELSSRDWNTLYVKNVGPSFRLEFEVGLNHNDKDLVSIVSKYGAYTFTQDVSDTESGIAVISSIVNSECLQMAKDMVDVLSVCDAKVTSEINAYVPDKTAFFGFQKANFKDMMIDRLETVLKQLKGE